MKKVLTFLLVLLLAFSLGGCRGAAAFREFEFTIPAGSEAPYVISEWEIIARRNKIEFLSGAALPDTEVVLVPVSVKEENAYEPVYITRGMKVKMKVEKGAQFKVGIAVQNSSDVPLAMSIKIKGVDVDPESLKKE